MSARNRRALEGGRVTAVPGLSDEDSYRPPSHPRNIDQPSENGSAMFPQLIDMETVAQRLGTTLRHVRRLVTERKIPYLKIGHFIRFDERDVEVWIDRQKVIKLDNAVETQAKP
jgi:excisionase family DNA binding protein